MPRDKQKINICTIGHVDSGKSTFLGKLIDMCGGIYKRSIDKYEKEAYEMGKGSFKYAWVLDTLKLERERGITINISNWKFETEKYVMSATDCPGHRDFIKNAITGMVGSDAVLLVVGASVGEFEAGISKDGQTYEHALLAFTHGVRQIIVVVNKMDDKSVSYSEARFEEIKKQMTERLKKIGFREENMQFIPVSGLTGDNLLQKSSNMPWDKGPNLLEVLDNIKPPKRDIDKPLRMLVRDVFKVSGIGTVFRGIVSSGVIKSGQIIQLAPTNIFSLTKNKEKKMEPIVTEVKSLECYHESLVQGEAGDLVSVNVKGVAVKDIRRGMVVSDSKDNPTILCKTFKAQIIVMDHPGKIMAGYEPVIDLGTQHISAKIICLESKLDRRTGKELEKYPQSIKQGEFAMAIFRPLKPMVVESYSEYPFLGRFSMRDMRKTVGIGVVKAVNVGGDCG